MIHEMSSHKMIICTFHIYIWVGVHFYVSIDIIQWWSIITNSCRFFLFSSSNVFLRLIIIIIIKIYDYFKWKKTLNTHCLFIQNYTEYQKKNWKMTTLPNDCNFFHSKIFKIVNKEYSFEKKCFTCIFQAQIMGTFKI